VGDASVLASITDRILSLPAWLVLALVFVLPALEASAFVGFVFPGEIAVILGGVAASRGTVPLWAVIVAAVSGAIIGDSVGYAIGRRWGTHLLHGTLGRLPIIREHLDKHLVSAQAYVRRRKGSAVFFGRFTAALRVLVPGLAGMSDVHYPSFLAYNVAGGALWGAGFAVLGYLAGESYPRVERVAGRVGLGLLGLVVLGLVLSRLLQRAASRSPEVEAFGDRLAATRPLSWVRHRFPGKVAWGRRRLDPKSPYGFWLTFAVAMGALTAWAFASLTQSVVGHDEAALLDQRVSAWVVAHRIEWLTSVMKIVTWLGSTAVIVPLALIVGFFFVLQRGQWRPLTLLAAGILGAVGLYEIVKSAVDRPRPPSAIWIGQYSGASFPSGHATQSIAFYAMLAIVLGTGRTPKAKAVVWSAAALVVLAVGASRLYLGAHWMTDVLGGCALGAMWVAAVVIVVATFIGRSRDSRVETIAGRHADHRRPSQDRS
jgi:membrane protein DedA with SNARE-associated domain/membrane-associated phospholipid phosphatase